MLLALLLFIIGAHITLAGGLCYFYLKDQEKYKELTSNSVFERVMDAQSEFADRLVPFFAIVTLSLVQLMLASETLSESEAAEFTNIITVGAIGLSPWEVMVYLMVYWLMQPFLGIIYDLLRSRFSHGEFRVQEVAE